MMKSTNSNSGFPILLNRKNILWLALTTMVLALLVIFSSSALEKKTTNSTKVEWLKFVQFKDPSRPTTREIYRKFFGIDDELYESIEKLGFIE